MVKHNNIISVLVFISLFLGVYYLHTEYGLPLSKPILVIIFLVILKLWLRTVNTATYILVHILFVGGLYLGFQHYAEKLKSISPFDALNYVESAIKTVSKDK